MARGLESSQGGPDHDDRVEMMMVGGGGDDRFERERWRGDELISYIEIRLKNTWYTLLS